MSNEKQRAAKEAVYEAANKDITSVCSGQFYIKNRRKWEVCVHHETCPKRAFYDKNKNKGYDEVTFNKVSEFRKCTLYNKKYVDIRNIIRLSIYNVLYMNEINCTNIYRIGEFIDKNDKESKKIYGALMKRVEAYNKQLSGIIGNKSLFFACFNDAMDEVISPIIDKFHKAIKLAMNDKNIKCTDELASVETAYTFVAYSISTIEKIVSDCKEYTKEILNLYSYRMIEISKILLSLSNWICTKMRISNVNISDDLACRKVFEEFQKNFAKKELFINSIDKAFEYEKQMGE